MVTASKQRVTAFVEPTVVTRAKVRGALEGLTISEMVEKALDSYAPKIEKNDNHINLKFITGQQLEALIPEPTTTVKKPASKITKRTIAHR